MSRCVNCFRDLSLTVMSLIHLELDIFGFFYRLQVRQRCLQFHFSIYGYPVSPTPFVKENIIPSMYVFACVKN